ncbi:MAG: nickel-responsive transcriptional regulator NikR [Candidatus Omnitrophota bacterium]
MSETMRFGVAMDKLLLDKFDKLIMKKGYENRSEAIRDLVRSNLIEEEWKAGNRQTVGTVTIVYNHGVRELSDILTELQHRYHSEIISCMHVHLDEHNCLEVLAVKGRAGKIKVIADKLIATKGVKHGKLVMTTQGKGLT